VVYLAVLVVWPMFKALLLAFQDRAGNYTTANFNAMTQNYQFHDAVRNTILFMVTLIPLEFVFAMCMAMLLQSLGRGRQFFLYVWTIPLAISDLAAGIVWLSIFTQNGYVNSVLVDLHFSSSGFEFLSYQHPVSIFFTAVVAEMWRSTSLVMLILLGGMQGVPKEYSEAAEVFGAGFWQRLFHVTLPLLRPSIRVALILRTIFAFQVFAVLIALAGQNLPVLGEQAYYAYTQIFDANLAAAYSLLILAASIISSAIYLTLLRSKAEVAGRSR
jgi:multiple sugar transport system permease protein